MKWAPFQLPSKRKPTREFWGVKRNSDNLPAVTLLNGTLPKLLPVPEPAFLSRQIAVRSMNPTGTRQVSPIWMKAGDLASPVASHGLDGSARFAAGACGAAGYPYGRGLALA